MDRSPEGKTSTAHEQEAPGAVETTHTRRFSDMCKAQGSKTASGKTQQEETDEAWKSESSEEVGREIWDANFSRESSGKFAMILSQNS